jgi:hypothetical protein
MRSQITLTGRIRANSPIRAIRGLAVEQAIHAGFDAGLQPRL